MAALRRGFAASVLLLALVLTVVGPLGAEARAQDDATTTGPDPEAGVTAVLEVSGLLDPIVADFVTRGIEDAEAEGLRAVTLQVNSRGSVLDQNDLDAFAEVIADAEIPVAMWVGPSGARALGAWVDLASLVDRLGVPLGSRIGEGGPSSHLSERFGTPWGDQRPLLANGTLNSEEALLEGIASFPAPTLGDFLVGLSELGIATEAVDQSTQLRTQVRIEGPSLIRQQLHTAASPPVAYLLFVIGLALLVFEFYTAGVGVAGVVGAVMFLLGCFGLWILPVNIWALALLGFAMFAFSVDVQTGVPRFWTIVGALALVVGTITLYRDPASMSWIPMVVGVVGITAMMVSGMPTMVRTRFSTPTIGREWMVGEVGEAIDDVDPDGVVRIREALWKARTNRATPIVAGGGVRVVAVEGLLLEVEPEVGGAVDYRERRSGSDD